MGRGETAHASPLHRNGSLQQNRIDSVQRHVFRLAALHGIYSGWINQIGHLTSSVLLVMTDNPHTIQFGPSVLPESPGVLSADQDSVTRTRGVFSCFLGRTGRYPVPQRDNPRIIPLHPRITSRCRYRTTAHTPACKAVSPACKRVSPLTLWLDQ